jgi:predicted metal-dependent hydrolase
VSALFPAGEKFFIDSVRAVRYHPAIKDDEALQKEPFIQYSGTSLKSKFIRRTGKLAPARFVIFTLASALSALFPAGEKFFIDSVRAVRYHPAIKDDEALQ